MVMMVIGLITAVIFYLLYPKVPKFLSSQFNPVYKFLLNKWYFDEIYEFILGAAENYDLEFDFKNSNHGLILVNLDKFYESVNN